MGRVYNILTRAQGAPDDPSLGTFLSPDTIVPDAGNVMAYNRFMYVYGNPMKYRDDSGNTPWDVVDVIFFLMSINDYRQNPTWANMGWLALDGVSTLPVIPSVVSYIRRGKQGAELATKITKMVTKHGDLALDFVKVAHKQGSITLLEKLIHSSDSVVKGAVFELEFAQKFSDQITEIDFVLSGNIFVNAKNYDWSEYNPFVLKKETENLVKQAKSYFKFDPSA